MFTQDTCTLVRLFCLGAATSDPLLSVVRAVLATCRTFGLWKDISPPVSSPLPSRAFDSSSCLCLSFLLAAGSPQSQVSVVLHWSGRVPPCGRSIDWLLGSRTRPEHEVWMSAAPREAGCGQTEPARCLKVQGALFSQNRAAAKLLIVALFFPSCLYRLGMEIHPSAERPASP